MEDKKIVGLFFDRDEAAIRECDTKYGKYCHSIAHNILRSNEDAEECVNDTFLRAWCAIPPEQPKSLGAFLSKITRNLALDRLFEKRAAKRNAITLSLIEELGEIAINESDSLAEQIALQDAINAFLKALPKEKRILFMRRYFFFDPIKRIAQDQKISESKVKTTLHRIRNDLKEHLYKEGIAL